MLNRQPGQLDGFKPVERGITVVWREFVKEEQEVGGTGVRCSVFRNWPDGISFLKPTLPRPISKNRTPDPGYIPDCEIGGGEVPCGPKADFAAGSQ
jgi:hypothetical protein